ncbi:host specificity protein, partial [Cribrihabitans sp. XS_ASV171]
GKSDFLTSMEALEGELPGCGAASLIVSWFGDDLRCGEGRIRPKVERKGIDGANMTWSAGGLTRATAQEVARIGDRPVYGGTPADAAVVEAIRHMRDRGQRVMFYPFILMEQLAGNGLPDPWSGAEDQPVLPWRGRITLSEAPGRDGSP